MITKCHKDTVHFVTETVVRMFFVRKMFLESIKFQATFFKKRLWHRCFPVNFTKFLRTPFFTEQLRWFLPLLDEIQNIKKMKTQKSKERKFEKKVREIYIVVFAFLLSTVEVGRW